MSDNEKNQEKPVHDSKEKEDPHVTDKPKDVSEKEASTDKSNPTSE